MKKILVIFMLATVVFTGCKHKQDDSDFTTKTVKIDRDGEVYLIKLNPTHKTYYADETGYVSGIKRSAVDESTTDTDFYIRSMNNKITHGLIQSESERSAARAVSLGHQTENLDNVIVGNTQKFYSIVEMRNSKTGERIYQQTNDDNVLNISKQINTECKYVGTHCIVYADNKNTTILDANNDYIADNAYTALGQKFDEVYEEVKNIIGDPKYTKYISDYFEPCTSKISILVSDLFGDAQENQESGTVGYFYSADLFKQTFLDSSSYYNRGLEDTDPNFIHSNGREMFYIDTTFLKENPNVVYSTLVHEFNHMINFVIKTLNTMANGQQSLSSAQACDTWFTEMLAMVTEDMFQKYLGLDDQHSPKARLTTFGIYYFNGFRNWNNKKVDQLTMYANTYAFGAFLARNFGGIPLVKEIAQNRYVDEDAITQALQKINPGKTYKDDKTGEEKPYDFYYVLKKFPLCTIYTEYGYDFSLNNRTGFENGSKLGFDAIDLAVDVQIGNGVYTLPLKYKYNKEGMLDILSNGFTVHHVGTNISSFTMKVPKYTRLEYYYVIK